MLATDRRGCDLLHCCDTLCSALQLGANLDARILFRGSCVGDRIPMASASAYDKDFSVKTMHVITKVQLP